MTDNSYINHKYHITKHDYNPFGLLSSFKVFKMYRSNFTDRPNYPVIIGNPSLTDVFYNISKGDIFLYFSTMGVFFMMSLFSTRHINYLNVKLQLNHAVMAIGNLTGLSLIYISSAARLKGTIDNGLRWKSKNPTLKYDFTSDLEKNTILGIFRAPQA
jgi:hypothetical protein